VGFDVERPLSRLRELVAALHHIWGAFQGDHDLRFDGDFYRLSLLTPVFNPGPIEHPRIPVYLAAVRPRSYRLAGEIADGVHIHPFHTTHYLSATALPALERGLEQGERGREAVTIVAAVFGVTAADPGTDVFARAQISFYGSTPAYAPVLEAHGWGDLAGRLRMLMARREFEEMSRAVTDDVLAEFAVYGETWDALGRRLRERYAGLADRVALNVPAPPPSPEARGLVAAIAG
jgi:probable F420-dependent oxidoreductase